MKISERFVTEFLNELPALWARDEESTNRILAKAIGSALEVVLGEVTPGRSLRDYFAGQALAGLLVTQPKERADETALQAYNLADAMLKQRSKGS